MRDYNKEKKKKKERIGEEKTRIWRQVAMCLPFSRPYCKVAKLQARIKLTALCSAIDKENLIELLGNQADAVIQWKLLEYFISI